MAAGGGPPFSRLSPKLVGLMLPSTIRASRSLGAPHQNGTVVPVLVRDEVRDG
jgi:hypothetical protein